MTLQFECVLRVSQWYKQVVWHIAAAWYYYDGQIKPKFNDPCSYKWSSDAPVYNIYGENVRKKGLAKFFTSWFDLENEDID